MNAYPSRRRSGKILGNLVLLGLVGVCIYFYANRDTTPTSSEKARAAQADPESALRNYLEVCYHFMHKEPGGSYDDMHAAVTQEDWDWYLANYDKLKVDPFNVSGGIDPTAGEALAKRSALLSLIDVGPNRPDAAITKKDIGGDSATFSMKYKVGEEAFRESDVRVVKVGDTWKVADFGGGRTALGGT